MPKVSVIIPVYNVVDYIDYCLQSIINQTFKDIEIILINDGSSDGSDRKCKEWASKDERVVYISKENEGAGPARNLGIIKAKGEYLTFVDSDDWVESTFIEKMYNAINSHNVEIVECDYYRVVDKSKFYISSNGVMGKNFDLRKRMLSGSSNSMWTMIIRRSFFILNKIEMPSLPYEDIAVYLIILAVGKSVYSLNEALYYYRFGRSNSNSNPKDVKKYCQLTDALEYLLNLFRKKNLFNEYKDVLERHANMYLTKTLARCRNLMEESQFTYVKQKYDDFICQYYTEFKDRNIKSCMIFGSYNLGKIANNLVCLADVYDRHSFSSIISVVDDKDVKISAKHRNLYRQHMINNDFSGKFFEILEDKNPEYLLIDFLEERYDIFEYNRSYYTKSDAFDESNNNVYSYSVIGRNSDECQKLWEESCLLFIEKLKNAYNIKNVILVENYLSEEYGDITHRKKYENIDEIKKINMLLKKVL